MELPEDDTLGGKKMPDSTDAQNIRIHYSKMNIYEISESTTYLKILQLFPSRMC
jgi:hypothetical protein